MLISPLSMFSSPSISFMVVVFPEPFGPRKPNISPDGISRLISVSIRRAPNCFERCFIESTGGVTGGAY